MECSNGPHASQGGSAEVAGASDPGLLATELRQVCQALMADLQVPGAAVGVLRDGKCSVFGEGVTNVGSPLPVTPATAFQVGSITKVVTATALMRLVEAGRLELDRRVREILPELRLPDPATEPRLTVRDLLTHRTGWDGDLYEQHGRGDDALARVIARIRDLDILVPFRTVVSYNNANFYVLGRILEVLTRMPYERAAGCLVLEPGGMSTSGFFADELMCSPIAVGHMSGARGISVARPWMTNRSWNPTGGLISTVSDLIGFARVQLGGGFASRQLTELMRQPQLAAVPIATDVCLPWWRDTSWSAPVYSHSGDTFTSQSLLLLVPRERAALVVLTNSNCGFSLIERIRKRFLEHLLGESEPTFPTAQPEPAALRDLAGHYGNRAHNYRVDVAGQRLVVNAEDNPGVWPVFEPPGDDLDPFMLRPIGGDHFQIEDGPLAGRHAAFCRDQEGTVRWFHVFGRAAWKLVSQETSKP